MTQYTIVDDWLHSQLSENDNVFISGHYSFSKRLGLMEKTHTSLRFAGNRNEIFGYFLTINTSYENWKNIEREIIDSEFIKRKVKIFSKLLNFPIAIIFYDNNKSGFFSLSIDLDKFEELDSFGLKKHLSQYNNKIVENPGTIKEVNKSINDSFQEWTRKNLSKFLTINDFDIIIPNKSMILELKNIKEDVETWNPYLDEKSNYRAQMKICKSNNLQMRIIAYQNDNLKISVHELFLVSDTEIKGQFYVCELDEIFKENVLTNNLITQYTSNRRRQIC